MYRGLSLAALWYLPANNANTIVFLSILYISTNTTNDGDSQSITKPQYVVSLNISKPLYVGTSIFEAPKGRNREKPKPPKCRSLNLLVSICNMCMSVETSCCRSLNKSKPQFIEQSWARVLLFFNMLRNYLNKSSKMVK